MANDSLMNKTKSELVEIILRKDDVEKRLRSQINDLKKENAEFRKQLSIKTESASETCQGDKKRQHITCFDFLKKMIGK